jgi:hypothetical protein
MAHFVVENELGIGGGIFGQLAAGGGTFQPTVKNKRKVVKRGKRMARANRADLILSEQVVYLASHIWNNKFSETPSLKGMSAEDIRRVCREFDAVSAVWSKLKVGESMTLVWRGDPADRRRLQRGKLHR